MINKNFFTGTEVPVKGEIFEILQKAGNTVIEKIVSSDIIPDQEYIQDHGEWVILLKGGALLSINNKKFLLKEGDYLFIEKGTPHKVLKTENGTFWLAVHIYD